MLDHLAPTRARRASGSSRRNLLPGYLAAGAMLLSSARAEALPLVTLAGNLRALYGSGFGANDLDPAQLGLGLSAGVTLPASLYLGASFNYFFGDSNGVSYRNGDTRQEVAHAEFSLQSYQLLAHIGYDLGLGPLTLRPSLAGGLVSVTQDFDGDYDPFVNDAQLADYTWSTHDFLLSPGLEGFLGFGLWNVSAEVRYGKPLTTSASSDASVFFGLGLGLSL